MTPAPPRAPALRAAPLWSGAALLGLALLQLATLGRLAPPAPREADAPPQAFSAARAFACLERVLRPETPHPTGTAAHAVVRARLLAELRALGCAPELQETWAWSPRARLAPLTNVLARLPGSAGAQGQAVLLLCHYDSVPAGPGASDDGMGMAAVLEIVRALEAGPPLPRPVLLLFTDGEELGLLGARAFLREHPWRHEVGAVVNLEARGTSGPSFMFQTSRGNAPLVPLLAGHLPRPLCSSLFPTVYELLPNDTDLTVFLEAEDPPVAFNFACIGDVDRYHTPLDDLAHLSPATLQHHGDNGLALVRALAAAPLESLRRAEERLVCFDLLGLGVVRWPEPWSVPLAALSTLATLVALGRLRRTGALRWRELAWGALLWVGGLALTLAGAWGLSRGLVALSGSHSPWAATPLAGHLLFWCLPATVCAALAAALLPRAGVWGAWGGAWLGWSLGGVALAALLPGASFALVAPALVAGAGGLAAAWGPRRSPGPGPGPLLGLLATVGPLLAAATLWLPMARGLEWALGLMLKLPVALAAGLLLSTLVPLLPAAPPGPRRWALPGGAGLLGLGCAALVLVQGPHSPERPMRVNLSFVEEAGAARWEVDARFGEVPLPLRGPAAAAATPEGLAPPTLTVLADEPAGADRRRVRVRIASPRGAWAASLRLLRPAAWIEAHGQRLAREGGLRACDLLALPPEGVELVLELPREPVDVTLWDSSAGLPAQGAALLRARPAWAVPSQLGDTTQVKTRARL